MKKILIALLVLAFSSVIILAAAKSTPEMFKQIPYKSAVWKSKTTVQSPEETITFEQTTYFKSNKMRTEGVYYNPALKTKEDQLIIITGGVIYMINKEKNQGVKYSLSSANNPKKNEEAFAKCRQSGKKTGSETVNEVKCDIYEYDCDVSGTPVRVKEWRSVKDGFIMRSMSQMNKITTTADISDLKPNADIPDSKFVPDPSIKYMDMEKIMTRGSSGRSKAADAEAQKMMKDMMKNMPGK
jgi:outer membrane lipoprotein-sorting protein